MVNFDDVIKEITKYHNSTWLERPDSPYRIIIVGGAESEKKYAKDPHEAKYQFLFNKQFLFNTWMIWMLFIKALKNKTQIKTVKY